jgi:hypothetical protein
MIEHGIPCNPEAISASYDGQIRYFGDCTGDCKKIRG